MHVQRAWGVVDRFSTEGFINHAFTYYPMLQGAIASINFSNDRFIDLAPLINPILVANSRSLLLENGK